MAPEFQLSHLRHKTNEIFLNRSVATKVNTKGKQAGYLSGIAYGGGREDGVPLRISVSGQPVEGYCRETYPVRTVCKNHLPAGWWWYTPLIPHLGGRSREI